MGGFSVMRFANRQDAGQSLGRYLLNSSADADIVVGLPRGGVVVAAEVARLLQRPLDILVVRKIGHPWHREFAVGALAEGGVTLLDKHMANENKRVRTALDSVIAEEQGRLREYQEKFHGNNKSSFCGRKILLVDDGLATGATAEAAVRSARAQDARKIFVAVPVASTSALERLMAVADGVTALIVDPEFDAVGQYYQAFAATTDEEVLALLGRRSENCTVSS
jgi:predicted phosphoribosyltransferase